MVMDTYNYNLISHIVTLSFILDCEEFYPKDISPLIVNISFMYKYNPILEPKLPKKQNKNPQNIQNPQKYFFFLCE